jgi:hypothetical protein
MTNPGAWTLIDFTAIILLAIFALAILGGCYLKTIDPAWILVIVVMAPVAVSITQAFLGIPLAGAVITLCVIAAIVAAINLWNETDTQ